MSLRPVDTRVQGVPEAVTAQSAPEPEVAVLATQATLRLPLKPAAAAAAAAAAVSAPCLQQTCIVGHATGAAWASTPCPLHHLCPGRGLNL
jgi:hypothetical protein